MNSLRGNLKKIWDSKKFPQSIIIESDTAVVQEILIFIKELTSSYTDIAPEHNTDIKIIELKANKAGDLQKFITVDQIRELQDFLNFTGGLSPYKFAIIKSAEQMNLNASNCCLKILEDTPPDSYIFLITDRPALLLSTIRSRCQIYKTSEKVLKSIDHELIEIACEIINPQVRFSDKQALFEKIYGAKAIYNNNDLVMAINTIFNIILKQITVSREKKEEQLTPKLLEIINIIIQRNFSVDYILKLTDKINKLLTRQTIFYLDEKQIFTILIGNCLIALE